MSASKPQRHSVCGLGSANPKLVIYIANRPAIAPYANRQGYFPVVEGELQYIAFNTSNHWRKVFNVYAKFWYALSLRDSRFSNAGMNSWQAYRDQYLLQAGSEQALVFSAPNFDAPCIHIVAGKMWAQNLNLLNLTWLDAYFAVDPERRLIICPYLDYRQLSNARIDKLVELVMDINGKAELE